MNVDRLREIEAVMLQHPKEVAMGSWHTPHPWRASMSRAHCIAGWAQVLFASGRFHRLTRGRFLSEFDSGVLDAVLAALGMEYWQAKPMFFVADWPVELREAYAAAKTPKEQVLIAVTRIEQFIAERIEETLRRQELVEAAVRSEVPEAYLAHQ